jgi:streptogramin lyase
MTFTRDEGLGGKSVSDIALDAKAARIWFATSDGLSSLDGRSGQWKVIDKDSSKLKGSGASCLFIDKDGFLLVGSDGAGLFSLAPGASDFEEVKCPLQHVNDIILDQKGRLWVSSMEGVAFRDKGVWVTYTVENSSLASNSVGKLAETPDGVILGASTKGMIVFDGISWSIMDTSNSALPVDHVSCILVEPAGGIWVGTWGGGLVQMDKTRQVLKVFSRRNSDVLDNNISALGKDSAGNFWLGTARGLSRLVVNPQPPKTEKVRVVDRKAYKWAGSADKPGDVSLQTAIARHHYGFPIWSWTAFWAEKGFDRVNPQVSLKQDLFNNRLLSVSGQFPSGYFAQLFVTEGTVTRNYREQPGGNYGFPGKFPPEISLCLSADTLIPSGDADIARRAKSLIRNSSKADMMKTAEDILFSRLFATMPFDYSGGEMGKEGEMTASDPRVKIHRTPQQVLNDNTGTGYSKNRLACTMLRSVGIPSRLVCADSRLVWGEAYIEGKGWVPFDVTMPYYTISEGSESRIRFPLSVQEQNLGVVWVGGAGDNLKPVFWRPEMEAVIAQGDRLFDDYTALDRLKTAHLLLMQPAEFDIIPEESKIPVSKTVLMMVRKDSFHYSLRFYDKSNGRLLSRTPIVEYDKTMTAEVEGRLRLTFIPVEVGKLIGLRMFKWEVLD